MHFGVFVFTCVELSSSLKSSFNETRRSETHDSLSVLQPKHIPCLNEDRVQSSGDAGFAYHTNQSYCPESASLF